MLRISMITAALAATAIVLAGGSPAASPNYPTRIDFTPGFRAEGIAVGRGHAFYAGDTVNGAIYAGDLRTGQGSILVPAQPGRRAFGVFADNRDRLFVAGGSTCHAYVYDAATGAQIADYTLTSPPCFINDVFVTKTGAYLTNTTIGGPVLFKIPIAPNGELGATAATFPTTPPVENTNGIDGTPDGKTLITIKFALGRVFTVDPETGAAVEIALTEAGAPATVPRGDGFVLRGRTLYVVQNVPAGNVTVVELAPDLGSGEIVARLNSDDDVDPLVSPATADRFGRLLYVVRRNVPGGTTFYLSRITLPNGD